MIAFRAPILLPCLDTPLILLLLSSVLNGFVMIVYIAMLLVLNRALPQAIRLKGLRLGVMVVCLLFFGFFAGWLIIASVKGLLGA